MILLWWRSILLHDTCYSYINVKFPGKDLLGQYISDFYRCLEFRDPKTMNKWYKKLHTLAKRDSSLCSGDV